MTILREQNNLSLAPSLFEVKRAAATAAGFGGNLNFLINFDPISVQVPRSFLVGLASKHPIHTKKQQLSRIKNNG